MASDFVALLDYLGIPHIVGDRRGCGDCEAKAGGGYHSRNWHGSSDRFDLSKPGT